MQAKIKDLVAIAKKKKSVLEYNEIMDFFGDIDLEPEQIDKIYETLEQSGIDILGAMDIEDETDKEIELAAENTINVDDMKP